jgi:hypothetical protein
MKVFALLAFLATFAVGMQSAQEPGGVLASTLSVDIVEMTPWSPSEVALGSLAFAQGSVPLLPEDDPSVRACFVRNLALGGFGLEMCRRYPWWIEGSATPTVEDPCMMDPFAPGCPGYCTMFPSDPICGGFFDPCMTMPELCMSALSLPGPTDPDLVTDPLDLPPDGPPADPEQTGDG